jgi:hypothetical protein
MPGKEVAAPFRQRLYQPIQAAGAMPNKAAITPRSAGIHHDRNSLSFIASSFFHLNKHPSRM